MSMIKPMILAPIVLSLLVSGQSFAAEPKQSVASMVQDFILTAQGKQDNHRSKFGESILASIQGWIQPRSTAQTNTQTLFASTQTIYTSTQTQTQELDGSVFFSDIAGHDNEQHIAILASHKLFNPAEKFFPHNYVRLADLSKIIINSYRMSIGLAVIDATPRQFVQTAFDEGFLTNIINQVTDSTIEKVITYADMQIILDNIHRQYPNISTMIDVSQPKNDILNKGAMSYYSVELFGLQANYNNYHNARFAHINESKHYQAMRTLIENNIISAQSRADQHISRTAFIQQVVKAYALDKRVIIQNIAHDIADLDNQNPDSALIVYAYDQGRLDYILIQTKGQIFLDPQAKITIDEVYEILSTITEKQFVTGIIQADTPMPQDQIAQAIMDAFGIKTAPEPTSSPIQNPTTSRLSLVQRVRSLFAQL